MVDTVCKEVVHGILLTSLELGQFRKAGRLEEMSIPREDHQHHQQILEIHLVRGDKAGTGKRKMGMRNGQWAS